MRHVLFSCDGCVVTLIKTYSSVLSCFIDEGIDVLMGAVQGSKMNIEFEITHSHISVTKVTVKITGNSDITLWIKISHIEDFFLYIYL